MVMSSYDKHDITHHNNQERTIFYASQVLDYHDLMLFWQFNLN